MARRPAAPSESLGEHERKEAVKRSSLGVNIVHEAIRLVGEEELRRPASALSSGRLPAASIGERHRASYRSSRR
jgi:hypothetical protein